MTKAILALTASLLAGAALAQSGAQVHASAATDAVKPPPASAASHASAATDALKPAAASINASAATDAARTKASAATDAPRLIPQPRKTKQPAAEAGKPVK
ncbi:MULTISPECIES: hypothetical protein [unclassified Janthinobacterium]|uniref:hypothetical protein n=1 Tax=unclassified Janthinobacterium TaxID=2610881 RepID=UPI000CB8D632|nr:MULTISPECIES: hypothetical protein [unclassified Janthinobacterium]PKV47943.1 hypothetical protein CLU92_5418 [Janthinobacterium sp. 61]TDY29975.1 hypothetical protein C8C89_4935 [Janthinobacterium sp. 75]